MLGIILPIMSLPSAWDELTVDDFPDSGLRTIAESAGTRVAADLWRRMAGSRIELPMRFTREYMVRYIRAHWDGSNDNQVARALGIHTRTVRRLVSEVPNRPQRTPVAPQLSMF